MDDEKEIKWPPDEELTEKEYREYKKTLERENT